MGSLEVPRAFSTGLGGVASGFTVLIAPRAFAHKAYLRKGFWVSKTMN